MTVGQIFHVQSMEFAERGNGILSLPLASHLNSEQLLTGYTEIPIGEQIPMHYHNAEEFILVVTGRATVMVDGREEHVQTGDATLVPPGIHHQFINSGDEPLRILWVYGDPNTTRTLISTGETLGHLDPYPESE